MLSTFYRVSIAGISGTGDAAGFIDQKKVEYYMANGGAAPATLTTSTNKTRANIRYKNIVENLQLMGNVYLSNVVANAATVDTAPTSITFTLESERGDETLQTADETTPGASLTGANAIVRCVARGLMESRQNYVYPVYDPTPTSAPNGPGAANAVSRTSSVTITFNVAALANALSNATSVVTVTQIV